ncbi:MAG TPA: winged helix-turn-helix domain-containing protein [Rhodocyclaceae bacterium]|nr:winged helix-turn-helix domain-containing protein [Rhodocyclaceae bacterium]
MSVTVLLIVDQPTVAQFLDANLRHAGLLTIGTAPGAEVAAVLESIQPDLILFDASSDQALQTIGGLREHPAARQLPWLVLGGEAAEKAFPCGQLLPRPLDARTLVTRVKAELKVHDGASDGKAIEVDGLRLDRDRHEVRFRGEPIALGSKEFSLLGFLMEHPERVFSREHLLCRVWGDDVFNTERTVDVTVRRLRMALEAHAIDDRIQTVRGAGYRFSA